MLMCSFVVMYWHFNGNCCYDEMSKFHQNVVKYLTVHSYISECYIFNIVIT
jgi:hypothetical protein